MARCRKCNRFVTLEFDEPETNLDLDVDGLVFGSVSLTSQCGQCGESLVDEEIYIEEKVHRDHTCDRGMEDFESLAELECVNFQFEAEEGGHRYLFKARLEGTCWCSMCGHETVEFAVEESMSVE